MKKIGKYRATDNAYFVSYRNRLWKTQECVIVENELLEDGTHKISADILVHENMDYYHDRIVFGCERDSIYSENGCIGCLYPSKKIYQICRFICRIKNNKLRKYLRILLGVYSFNDKWL